MSKLLFPVGYPKTVPGGTEMLGKGVNPSQGTVVEPNGKVAMPAVAAADVAAQAAAVNPASQLTKLHFIKV